MSRSDKERLIEQDFDAEVVVTDLVRHSADEHVDIALAQRLKHLLIKKLHILMSSDQTPGSLLTLDLGNC